MTPTQMSQTVFTYQPPGVKLVRWGGMNEAEVRVALAPAHQCVCYSNVLCCVVTWKGGDETPYMNVAKVGQFIEYGTGTVMTRQAAKEKYPNIDLSGAP